MSYKDKKLYSVVREFRQKASGIYEINGVDLSRAVFLYREKDKTYIPIPSGDYRITAEIGNNFLVVYDRINNIAYDFQVIYETNQKSSKYTADFPEIEIIQAKFNQVVEDIENIIKHLKTVGVKVDGLNSEQTLPRLEANSVWVANARGELEIIPFGDLNTKYNEMLTSIRGEASDLLGEEKRAALSEIANKISELENLRNEYIRSVESAKTSNINEINLAKTSCIEYVDGIKNDVKARIDRLETALDSREEEITTLVRTRKREIENSVNSKISNLERIKNNYINEVNSKNESVETSIRNGLELLENKKNTELERLSRDIEGRALGIKEDLASFVNERKSEVSSQIQGLDGLNTRIDDLNTKIEAKEEAITTKNTGFNLNKTDSFNEDDTNKLASAKAVHDLGLSLREAINNIEIPASSGGGSGGSDNTRVSKRGDTMTGHLVINKSDCWIKGKHDSEDKWVLGKTSTNKGDIELIRSHGNNRITLEENSTKFNKPLNLDIEYGRNNQKLVIGNMSSFDRETRTSYIYGTENALILGVVNSGASAYVQIKSEGIFFKEKELAFADGIESMIFELMTGNRYKIAEDNEDIRRFGTDVFVAKDSDSPRPTPFLKVNESADTFSFDDTENFIPIDNKSLGIEIYKIRNAVKYLCEQAGTNIDAAAEEGVGY